MLSPATDVNTSRPRGETWPIHLLRPTVTRTFVFRGHLLDTLCSLRADGEPTPTAPLPGRVEPQNGQLHPSVACSNRLDQESPVVNVRFVTMVACGEPGVLRCPALRPPAAGGSASDLDRPRPRSPSAPAGRGQRQMASSHRRDRGRLRGGSGADRRGPDLRGMLTGPRAPQRRRGPVRRPTRSATATRSRPGRPGRRSDGRRERPADRDRQDGVVSRRPPRVKRFQIADHRPDEVSRSEQPIVGHQSLHLITELLLADPGVHHPVLAGDQAVSDPRRARPGR